MSDELMSHFMRNMASLRQVTFQDSNGTTLKVLGSTERVLVLLNLLDHANTETGLVYVGATTTAKETGLDRSNVRAARNVLVQVGWLTPAGSVDYAGQLSKKAPGQAKKGRRSPVNAYRVTLPGQPADLTVLRQRAVELPPTDGVTGGVLGGVLGGVTITPRIEIETETPPQQFSETGQPSPARTRKGAEKRKHQGQAEQLTDYLVKRDLEARPSIDRPGPGLLKKKAAEARPHAERVAALPCAASEPKAAERVAWAWYNGAKPDKFDLARLEGKEAEAFFQAEKLPPVPGITPAVSELMKAAKAAAKAS